MATVLRYQDFEKPPFDLPGVAKDYIQEQITDMIEAYEPTIAHAVIGETLYNQLLAGLEEDPVPAKWTALKAVMVDVCRKFVYYRYRFRYISDVTETGETMPDRDNATQVDPSRLMIEAINEMLDDIDNRLVALCDGNADYPDYEYVTEQEKINCFGF